MLVRPGCGILGSFCGRVRAIHKKLHTRTILKCSGLSRSNHERLLGPYLLGTLTLTARLGAPEASLKGIWGQIEVKLEKVSGGTALGICAWVL